MRRRDVGALLGPLVFAGAAACSGSPAPAATAASDGGSSDAGRVTDLGAASSALDASDAGAPDAPAACTPDAATAGTDAAAVVAFERRVLDTTYRTEGVGVFDVDNDGHLDIVTDQVWYAGPSLTPHEVRAPVVYSTTTQYAHCFGVFPTDLNRDGYLDMIIAPHVGEVMLWYENPRGNPGARWTPHVIAEAGVTGLETPYFVDLFGDCRPVLLATDSVRRTLGWYEPPADPTLPWVLRPIATSYAGAGIATHGIGVGDVDGDGLNDVLTGFGWFQQTATRTTWIAHPVSFGPDPHAACSRMYAADLDGDGLNDILCARPHDYGLRWFQQRRSDAGGDRTFTAHLLDDTLSVMHALRFDDLNGDGVPEIVTGKRWRAHGDGSDPGGRDPAMLSYWMLRGAGTPGVSFERHDIDDASGVGGSFAIADVDGDGRQDIVTGNKRGVFYFRQR